MLITVDCDRIDAYRTPKRSIHNEQVQNTAQQSTSRQKKPVVPGGQQALLLLI